MKKLILQLIDFKFDEIINSDEFQKNLKELKSDQDVDIIAAKEQKELLLEAFKSKIANRYCQIDEYINYFKTPILPM